LAKQEVEREKKYVGFNFSPPKINNLLLLSRIFIAKCLIYYTYMHFV